MKKKPVPNEIQTETETLSAIEKSIVEMPHVSTVFEITPSIARVLLEKYNTGNRPKKDNKIKEYRADMKSGQWAVTGDTIKFSDKRRLRDGQNRLLACVEAGVSFRTYVVFGIEDGSFWWMDRGKNRNASDGLAVAGWSNSKAIAATARWIYLIQTGKCKQRSSISPSDVNRIVADLDRALLQEAATVGKRIYHVDRSPAGMVGACFYCMAQADADLAQDFFTAWQTGRFEARFSALEKALKLIRGLRQQQAGRLHETVQVSIFIQAWNLVRQRRAGSVSGFETDALNMPFPKISGAE